MLAVKEMALLGLVLTLTGLLTVIIVIPVRSNVQVSLIVNPQEEALRVAAGKPLNVTCRTVGGDERQYSSMKWIKDGKEIPEGIPGVQRKGNNFLTLIFTEPKTEESGVYKCLSTYGGELKLEKQVSISFYGSKPTFMSGFQNVTAEEGSSTEILCQATGELPITYTWYNPFEDEITKSARTIVSNSFSASILSLKDVSTKDEGIYTCLAGNQHGLSSKLYQLIVSNYSIPDNETTNVTAGIYNVTVLGVTTNSVEFDFTLFGDAKIIQVNYSEIRNTTNRNLLWRSDADNFTVENLIPGGLYSFSFRPFPGGEWTRAINVTLLPDVPEVIFQNIGKGTVRIAWERKFDDIMRKAIDRYELTYFTLRRLGINDTWEPNTCAVTITIPSCSNSYYTITGLSTRIYYELQLKAHTKAGYGEPYKQKIYIVDEM